MNFRALLLLFGFLDAAFCAPYGAQDECGDVRISSMTLNHLTKNAVLEARNGSTDQASFSSSYAFVEAEDMCGPQSLMQTPMPCVGKIFRTLKSYSSAVKRISGFQSCMKSARQVEEILEKLQRDMKKCVESLESLSHHHLNSVIKKEESQPIEHWKEPLLCRYTFERLFSFSIVAARVFAAGDPAQHTAGSAQKCM